MNKINFTPFPSITTERLALRRLKTEDKQEVFNLRADDGVVLFQDRPTYRRIEESLQFIRKINDDITKNESILWAITLINTDKVIGTICLWNISEDHTKAEIGFELLPLYQGKGIMQEAVARVIHYGFENMKLISIDAYTNPSNVKSIRLLERNNFLYFKTVVGNSNEVVYTLKK